jgi:hypothetical protein
MYLQKGISMKTYRKITDEYDKCSVSGSVGQRYGSEDPDPHSDPYQFVTDPEHCIF